MSKLMPNTAVAAAHKHTNACVVANASVEVERILVEHVDVVAHFLGLGFRFRLRLGGWFGRALEVRQTSRRLAFFGAVLELLARERQAR